MRTLLFAILTGIGLAATTGEAEAQQRFIYRNTYVAPTIIPGNYGVTSFYSTPYYQGSVGTGIYPTPYGGYNAYSTTTQVIRPVYMGPYHSVIWDPTTLSYRYVSGYNNTPNYSFYNLPNTSLYNTPNTTFYTPNYNLYNPYQVLP